MQKLSRITRIFRHGQEDCLTVRKHSSQYLDGELPQPRFQRVKSHLDGCAPCRAFISGLEHTVALLGRLPRSQPPQSLKQSIIERAKEQDRDKGRDEPHQGSHSPRSS